MDDLPALAEQWIGASRSQGYGTYEVTRWDPIDPPKTKRTRT